MGQPDDTGDGRSATLGASHLPLRQAVTDELRRAIVEGRYQPGERLYEEIVAGELAVSRNPVREALQTLAAEGFVELEPRRGARVAHFSRERVRELFEVREALEALVARLAAERRSPEHLARLEEVVARGRDEVDRSQLSQLPRLNTGFHSLLTEAAGNRMLRDQLERLSDLIRWIYAERIHDRSHHSWKEHADIVDAIRRADPDDAARCAARHVANARDAFLSSLAPTGDGR